MKKMIVLLAVCLVAGLAIASLAAADTGSEATATPWVYDPDGLGNSSAVWETAGGQNVLDLQKNAATESNQAAGATIDGFADDPLFELSFDVRGYCNNGAPRINVYEGDSTHFFGCALGTHTALSDGWTHVEFTCDQPGANCPEEAFVTIDGMDVVQDEQGQTELRNISVNGIIVGPPVPAAVTFVAQQNRAGYCAAKPVARPGQDDGQFLDLLLGQNTSAEWKFANAVPAYERADNHAITCTLPAGFHTTGQTDGIYPLISK